MKLSDAIRLGSMLKPQGYGSRSLWSEDASCVLGAAADAVGMSLNAMRYSRLMDRWPVLNGPSRVCPVSDCVSWHAVPADCLIKILWHLNDTHKWTRERIADFVASVEPPDPSVTGDAVSETTELPVGSLRV